MKGTVDTMSRFLRSFPLISVVTLTALMGAGCGGGRSNDNARATVRTTGNGSLSTVTLGPSVGSTFISRAQTFTARWNSPLQPPSEFTAELHRYLEARGGEGRRDDLQKVDAVLSGNNQWTIRRRDNFNLDSNGVYYLRLTSPGNQEYSSVYIVDESRAAQSRAFSTGGNGTLAQGFTLEPRPGTVFISRDQEFILNFPNGTAPSNLGFDLYRYEEARGNEPRKISKERINIRTITPSRSYGLRIDNGDDRLAAGGVYYIQIEADGEVTQRFAYIVTNN